MAKTKKKERTLINFILDETGSMETCKEATISGFNEYIDSLKSLGDVSFTLTKFNSDKIKRVCVNKEVGKIKRLTTANYFPTALTPLYDAIGQTIKGTDSKDIPLSTFGKVLCVIMTDGYENASKEYTREAIFALIKEKEKENWSFVFLGANQDSWAVGQSLGLAQGNVKNYSTVNTRETFGAVYTATACYSSSDEVQTKDFFKDTEDLTKNG